MKKYIFGLLVLSFSLATTAQARALLCTNTGVTTTVLEITNDGFFTLTETYEGSFPHQTVQMGYTTVIDGAYQFIAYNVLSTLNVQDSVGVLTIGDDSPITLNCQQ